MNIESIGLRFGLLLGATIVVFAYPEVNTTYGTVRGVWLKTKGGKNVTGFIGLPYADPPVGDLRFENPRLWNKNWTGIRNATKDGSSCLQVNIMTRNVTGSEDCLYLNVFTPTIANNTNNNKTDKKKLSVIVFVHGGAFNRGSSNSSLLAPTYLLDYDIVLVTLNYRLNVFGFFSFGNTIAPGNYALKDIVTALRWVKKNIETFGGDPNSVTLVGPSAAAAAVQLVASSPSTEGLFHKIISMSGSPTATWAVHDRETIRNESMRVAKLLGCLNETNYSKENITNVGNQTTNASINSTTITTKLPTNVNLTKTTVTEVPVKSKEVNSTTRTTRNVEEPKIPSDKEIMECLKKADPKDIVLHAIHEVWRRNPDCIFGPTLEPEAEGAILTMHPVQSLKEGLFRDVPWITGVVSDEGLLKTTDLLLNTQIKNELIKDYEKLFVPYVLEMDGIFGNVTSVTQAIDAFYFNNSRTTNLENNVTQAVGDALITWPTYNFLQKRLAKMKSNVYLYLFDYEGTFSSTFRWGYPYRFGVAHYDDINYLFPFYNGIYKDLQYNNTMGDITMINVICEMWTNFAKTGIPSARLTTRWEPYQKNHRFMRLGHGLQTTQTMEQEFLPKRMAFWDNLMTNFSLPIKEYKVENCEKCSNGKKKNGAEKLSLGSLLCLGVSIFWIWWSLLF